MGENAFLKTYEGELTALAKAGVGRDKSAIAVAATALFVKFASGSSILAGAAEQIAAKAFGQWFADNATARLLKLDARYKAEAARESEWEAFGAWLEPRISRALKSAELLNLEPEEAAKSQNQTVYLELFGEVLRGHVELKEDHADLEKGHAEIKLMIKKLIDAFSPDGQGRQSKRGIYGVARHRSVVFVGRNDEMERLAALLTKATHVRLAASIEGLAGIGKTELALQLAYKLDYEQSFPGGIFWLDASNPDLSTVLGTEIADAYGDIAPGPAIERAHLLINKLSHEPQRVLIILDNVEDWSRESEPHPLPRGAHISFLVTTRVSQLGNTLFEHFDIGVLCPPFDRELVVKTAGRGDMPGLDELLRYLDGHALALELAGAYLGRYKTTKPASYLKELQAHGGAVEAKVSARVRYEKTLDQALQAIWDKLDQPVRDAWRTSSFFAAELATSALASAAGMDEESCLALSDLHLIETASDGRWRMHRLTQSFGRRTLYKEERIDFQKRFLTGCVERSRLIDNFETGYQIYLPDKPHFDLALEQIAIVLDEIEASELQSNIGAAFISLGSYTKARELLELALENDLKNLGQNHPSVAARRQGLAVVLRDLGEPDNAREQLQLALESDLKNFSEEHPTVAVDRSNLATVLGDLGELEKAREQLQLALDSDLKNLGEEHPNVAVHRSNLATVLRDLGELEKAREQLQLALDSGLKNLGKEHPNIAVHRSILAAVLLDLGRVEEAREQAKKALKIVQTQPEGSYVRSGVERMAKSILEAEPRLVLLRPK
jgi:tetratricopeptide (TPR) repeat protein